MTPFRLTTWFRKRMLPLVVVVALIVAGAAPTAFYVIKRRELVRAARADAARAAEVVRTEIEARPTLWRYDANKLGLRLAGEGLDRAPLLVVRDGDGRDVAVGLRAPSPPAVGPLLYGRADVVALARHGATVWVGVDGAVLVRNTVALAIVFAALALVLGTVLYQLPTRAIGRAERRIHSLVGQLTLTLQEEERHRIARDLHDGVGQAITAARLGLVALRKGGAPSDKIDAIARELDEALDEVRRSTAALAPPALAELGLGRALARHCDGFAAASGLNVRCTVAEGLPRLDPLVETACYRIVQEALTNVARHAAASSAWVTLGVVDNVVTLEIGDDGRGLPDESERGDGRGLDGIRRRIELLGGTFSVGDAPGGGCVLGARIPRGETA